MLLYLILRYSYVQESSPAPGCRAADDGVEAAAQGSRATPIHLSRLQSSLTPTSPFIILRWSWGTWLLIAWFVRIKDGLPMSCVLCPCLLLASSLTRKLQLLCCCLSSLSSPNQGNHHHFLNSDSKDATPNHTIYLALCTCNNKQLLTTYNY